MVKAPRQAGARGVAVLASSGGAAILAIDEAEKCGLTVPEPNPILQERLREMLPGHCSVGNPVDLTRYTVLPGGRGVIVPKRGAGGSNPMVDPRKGASQFRVVDIDEDENGNLDTDNADAIGTVSVTRLRSIVQRRSSAG